METIARLATRLLSDAIGHPYECVLCERGYESPRVNCPACGSLDVEATR